MRAPLPSPLTRSAQAVEPVLDKIRHHQAEVAVLSGMAMSICLLTGGALSVLFSPNLGEQLLFPSILKPGSLQEGRISIFGNTILELSRPLRIEIVDEATSEDASTQQTPDESVTIVSPAEFQPQILEEAQERGTQLLLLTLLAFGGLYGAVRLLSQLQRLGPKRRQPLGERLAKSQKSLLNHPLAAKPRVEPSPEPVRRTRRIPAGAFIRLGPASDLQLASGQMPKQARPSVIPPNAFSSFSGDAGPSSKPTAVTLPAPVLTPRPLVRPQLTLPQSRPSAPTGSRKLFRLKPLRMKFLGTKLNRRQPGQKRTSPSSKPPRQAAPAPKVESSSTPPQEQAAAAHWLSDLDMRSESPLTSLL